MYKELQIHSISLKDSTVKWRFTFHQKNWQKTTQSLQPMKNHEKVFALTGYFESSLDKTCFSEGDYRFQPTNQHPIQGDKRSFKYVYTSK